VNCSQARALLAIYRDIQQDQECFAELQEHLESCAVCRRASTQQVEVGNLLRTLPTIQPDAAAHDRLMQALAAEHVLYMQQTANAHTTPPPAFLKPYIKQRMVPETEPLAALSTATTGPLPVIQMPRRRPRRQPLNHMAIVGIAAALLLVVMTAGLASLLAMSHNGLPGNTAASINNPVQVSRASYTTSTAYPHVTSAVANRNTIYYTAQGEGNTGWMLEEFDMGTNFSIPLLTQESMTPLTVLGTNQNWLVWLQFDASSTTTKQSNTSQAHPWSLYALNLDSSVQAQGHAPTPITLLQDTFNRSAVPSWVHNPIQGVTFVQNTLFVASVDSKGVSHLQSFQLNQQQIQSTQIASASNAQILASPTANNDGTKIFWSEEWQTSDNLLHSNIWTQQQVRVASTTPARWTTSKFLYRSDGMSFHPQFVNDTLFFLSTNPVSIAEDTPTAATATTTATAVATPSTIAQSDSATSTQAATSSINPTIVAQTPDASLQGTLFAVLPGAARPTAVDTSGQDSIPQGGARFVLWQNSNKGLEMYDAVTNVPVTVKNIVPNGTAFLTVNGDTAVWTTLPNTTAPTSPSVTFSTFSWPAKP
jgi:hypothetical protein